MARIFATRAPSGVQGVTGLNNVPGIANPNGNNLPIVATCETCHNNVNVGNDNFLDPKHTGIEDNSYLSVLQKTSTGKPAIAPPPDMPLFSFLCPLNTIEFFSNPVTYNGKQYDLFQTTDPGVGLITGQCSDLGKMKVPVLRDWRRGRRISTEVTRQPSATFSISTTSVSLLASRRRKSWI